MRPDFRVFAGALPALIFLVANWLGPTQLAIACSFVVSTAVFFRYPGSGVIRALTVLSFSIVAGAAIAGLALGSGKAFVAQNLIGDFAITAISLVSVAVRRPLAGAIAREMVPRLRRVMALDHRVFMMLTVVNAALNLGTGVARIFLLDALTENQYVIVSRVVFLPLSIAYFLYCYRQITRTAVAIWPDDMPPPDNWRPTAIR